MSGPVVLIIGGIYLLGARWFDAGPWGLAVGVLVAWLWWSFTVPRWRRWAVANGADPEELQALAKKTGLVWAKGSFLEKTELR